MQGSLFYRAVAFSVVAMFLYFDLTSLLTGQWLRGCYVILVVWALYVSIMYNFGLVLKGSGCTIGYRI